MNFHETRAGAPASIWQLFILNPTPLAERIATLSNTFSEVSATATLLAKFGFMLDEEDYAVRLSLPA